MAFTLAARSSVASRAFRATRPQANRPITISRAPLRGLALITLAADANAVLADVRSIVAEQLGVKLEDVSPESKFVDLGADSLDTVEMMMAFEEKFGLTMDEEGAEKIATVQEAATLIAQQLDSK